MQIRTQLAILSFSFFIAGSLSAQSDSIPRPFRSPSGQRPYTSVITTKAISSNGLFLVHKIEEKYFFEIPGHLLGRDLLIVTRLSKAAAELRSVVLG